MALNEIVLFGGTGSAGGCVLRTALASSHVSEVRAVTRRAIGANSPKLRETVHHDYLSLDALAEVFAGTNACFYCLGKSVRQTSGETEYRRITYDFAIAAATALRAHSATGVFHFISGTGAALDSRFMWARVKRRRNAIWWRNSTPFVIDPRTSMGCRRQASRRCTNCCDRSAGLSFDRFDVFISPVMILRAMLAAAQTGMRSRILTNAQMRALAG